MGTFLTCKGFRPRGAIYFFNSPVQFVTSTIGVGTLSGKVLTAKRFPSGAKSYGTPTGVVYVIWNN
jgi:hypothetical protein